MCLRRSMVAAQRLLQKDPRCQWSRAGLEASRETLQCLIASRNVMLFRSLAAWWSKNEDKVNKQFFMHKQPRTNYSYNLKLVKEDGSMSEDILEAITSNYHELLSDSYNSPEQPAMIEYVVEGMQHKFSNATQANLAWPLLE